MMEHQEVFQFLNKIMETYGNIVKSVVLFGSYARGEAEKESDIDLLVILDDERQCREIVKRDIEFLAREISEKLSVHVYYLTEFFDYARSGQPFVCGVIRDGVAVYDTGFFAPWKQLLREGKNAKANLSGRLLRCDDIFYPSGFNECEAGLLASTRKALR